MDNQGESLLIASRLTKGVLVKASIELVLVCLLVSWAAYSNLHPSVRGVIDSVAHDRITGWAYDPDSKERPVEVHLYIDERFVASQLADQERADLVTARVAAGPNYGFYFTPPTLTPGRHAIQVYVVRDSFKRGKILLPLARNAVTLGID